MQKVALPKKINFNKIEGDAHGEVIIEPCYPGYGTTLGNSLRRVLLSSLKGSAVIGIKINGAGHEFTTIENVKEDVLEIVLNLKGLRMNFFGEEDEIIKLELKAKGAKKVTAQDITKNSKVEIVNPDLHLAEITDGKGELEMEIYAASGYGYSAIEGRETLEKEVGYIEVDSIFSPIRLVKVGLENVRVGQMTDWEKLILEIKTDGTISFSEAFKQAAEILLEQVSFLAEQAQGEKNKKEKVKSKKKEKKDEQDEKSGEQEEQSDDVETEEENAESPESAEDTEKK